MLNTPSRDRQRLFRQSAVKRKAHAPVLDADEWTALKQICRE